jgi:hypothetical protein
MNEGINDRNRVIGQAYSTLNKRVSAEKIIISTQIVTIRVNRPDHSVFTIEDSATKTFFSPKFYMKSKVMFFCTIAYNSLIVYVGSDLG